ncbi:cupin domain-containing protein [Amnibacterium sp. CER49]|uniref:cupin domain-containing protein n=1 Tax=Amnibacterium sp. CER49 TaxID=3039161 RepID=UPI0024491D88|nr:cupin domain-containing protein [Amnibacterium sp. CER49]MDH2443508.1 cupin domain-containing protein [Amnibacterium sp. CER49]
MNAREHPVDLRAVAGALEEYWSQEVVGEANGSLFKVAKGAGSTRWHAHEDQDEVFVLLEGALTVQLRDRDVVLTPGGLFVVPRGVEHCPTSAHEARFLIVGTSITSNAAGGKPAWSYGGGHPR